MQGTIRSTLSHIDAPVVSFVYFQPDVPHNHRDRNRWYIYDTDGNVITKYWESVKSELLLADSWHAGR